MFELRIENPIGETMELTHNERNYQVLEVEGLDQPNAEIINTKFAGMDGSKYASSRLQERTLLLTVKINGTVEANRLRLYRYFGTKQWCKVYFKNKTREVYAEGYVESNDCKLFTNKEVMIVSIVCHDPYFYALKEIESNISQVLPNFEFPFAIEASGIEFSTYVKDRVVDIYNEGEEDTGVEIEITATGTVVNPTVYNTVTRESFGLKVTLVTGDVVTINTNAGQKTVRCVSNGIERNYINKVVRNSTWLTLAMGDNLMTYDADQGAEDMQIIFKHRDKYKAV